MSCPWGLEDGAYLLGALPPEDRRGYEEHLAGCDTCAAALREVAGLPGLLSRLPAEAIEAPAPPPATLLPALLAAAQTQRVRDRRRLRLVLGGALAAAAAVVALALVVPRLAAPKPAPPTSLARMVDAPISASVVLVDRAWGTEVDLTCTYAGPLSRAPATYLLVATDRSGQDQQIATWRVITGRPVTVIAATALRPSELSTLEIRSPAGRPILRLQR